MLSKHIVVVVMLCLFVCFVFVVFFSIFGHSVAVRTGTSLDDRKARGKD